MKYIMKQISQTTIITVLCLVVLSGCLGQYSQSNQTGDPVIENSVETGLEKAIEVGPAVTEQPMQTQSVTAEATETAPEGETITLGSITHSVANPEIDENGKYLPLQYNGGELQFTYQATVSGPVTNWGFLIFVDGILQPYKVDSTDAAYEFMHQFELTDGKPEEFTFIFTPITGRKGDTLEIHVASVFYPAFTPDLVETLSYGLYHSMMDAYFPLVYNQDPVPTEDIPMQESSLISNIQYSTEPVTDELKAKFGIDDTLLADQVFSELLINGTDMTLGNKLQLDGSGTIHVTYKLFGRPNAAYQTTVFIDHQPLTGPDGYSTASKINEGEVTVIDFDIDVSTLQGFDTFYLVSVASDEAEELQNNPQAFPLPFIKTNSILLY